MLWTILVFLLIVALVIFVLNRRTWRDAAF